MEASPLFDGPIIAGTVLVLRPPRGGERTLDFEALAAGLAHEIKNPLAGLQGSAELLAREAEGGAREYAQVIAREAKRVDGLVRELLDLARPAALQTAPVDVHQVLGDVPHPGPRHPRRRRRAPSPSATTPRSRRSTPTRRSSRRWCSTWSATPSTRVHGRPGASVTLESGVAPFRIRNAGGGQSRPLARIAVIDNGPGIPEPMLARLFTPFATSKPHGTGLGLAISRRIIEAHHGRIEVRNRPGGGAEAAVFIPLELGILPSPEGVVGARPRAGPCLAREQTVRKVLIVDDESSIRFVLARTCERAGVPWDEAGSAEEARQKLRATGTGPDGIGLLLLDVRLPGDDGLKLLSEIGGRPDSPFVVVMTAEDTMRTAVEAMKRGAADYLGKPFDLNRVERLVRELAGAVGRGRGGARAGRRRRRRRRGRAGRRDRDVALPETLVGRSAAMVEVYKEVGRVARTEMTVLLMGESGTGKELVARAVHVNSARAKGPFITVNMAAIPKDLIESELYGHEKGSFTGAVERRPGKFELAQRRHALPRRDRGDAHRPAGQAPARAPGARGGPGGRPAAPRRWTCASWPPPTPISPSRWRRGASAATSTTAWRWCPSASRRSASARATWSCWPATSSPATASSSRGAPSPSPGTPSRSSWPTPGPATSASCRT